MAWRLPTCRGMPWTMLVSTYRRRPLRAPVCATPSPAKPCGPFAGGAKTMLCAGPSTAGACYPPLAGDMFRDANEAVRGVISAATT